MINCPGCEELVDFGEERCASCEADLSAEFWKEAYDKEVLTFVAPYDFPWDIGEAYNNNTHAEKNCDECMWYQTDLCRPLYDWLYAMCWGDDHPQINSIHPCTDYQPYLIETS